MSFGSSDVELLVLLPESSQLFVAFGGGVILGPVGTAATVWPVVPAPDNG
jgi:hypothetical protein